MYQPVEEEGEFLNVIYIIITVSGIKVEESRGCTFINSLSSNVISFYE